MQSTGQTAVAVRFPHKGQARWPCTHHLKGSFSMQSLLPQGAAAGEPSRRPYLRQVRSARCVFIPASQMLSSVHIACTPPAAVRLLLTCRPPAARGSSRTRRPPWQSGVPGPSRGWAAPGRHIGAGGDPHHQRAGNSWWCWARILNRGRGTQAQEEVCLHGMNETSQCSPSCISAPR